MRYALFSLLSVIAFTKRVAANSPIAEGLAKVVLMQQGVTPEEISRYDIENTQRSYEQALGYYENYPYEETATFDTTSGPTKGAKFAESYAFYSIPFAQPPVRFQAPLAITTPLSSIDATKPDIVVCEQVRKNCTNGVCTQNTNEDCLVLNVHAPLAVDITATGAATSVRPVLVWFHGGGFFGGAGTIPEFEARYFAEQTDAVIVTVNYRLGAFGFLVHGEGENAIEGNFGIKDQQLALQWVQSNIAKFGGNPDMVTIFGNSAGAQSVMLHLISPVSKPLFHRAIMESNPAVFQYQTIEEAKRVSARLVRMLNCTGTTEEEQKCLMEADPEVLNVALLLVMPYSLIEDQDIFSTVEAFRPVLDGVEFRKQPLESFRDGDWSVEKDVIVGTNANELEVIQYYIPRQTPGGTPIPFPERAFIALNRFLFGNETGDMVSERYKADYGDGFRTDYRVLLGIEASHMFFMCPSRLMARFASTTATAGKVYYYNNIQPMDGPTCPDVVKPVEMCGLAFHGAEPPFIFRSGPFYGYDFRNSDTNAANQFNYYWTNFAVTGNPSDKGTITGAGHSLATQADWPEYNDNSQNDYENDAFRASHIEIARLRTTASWQNIMINGEAGGNAIQDGYLEDICDFWDSLNYYVDLTPSESTTTSAVSSTTSTGADKTTTSIGGDKTTNMPVTSQNTSTPNVGGNINTTVAAEATTSSANQALYSVPALLLSSAFLALFSRF